MRLWLNPAVTAITVRPARGPLSSIASADFDGDGNVDVAAMGSFDSSVFVAFGAGDGTFGGLVELEPPNFTFASALDVADMDNDGDVDIVLNVPPIIFVNDGTGAFPTTFERRSERGDWQKTNSPTMATGPIKFTCEKRGA